MRAVHIGRSAYLALAALTIACSPSDSAKTATPDAGAHAAVDSAANRLLAALRTDNADSLLALMANDVIIMPPNEAVLNGKPAVRTWYEAFVKQMHTTSLTISNRELLLGGDYATEVAQFEWTLKSVEGGPEVIDRGSYMQVWHREPDGHWLFSREVWNSMAQPGK
jgi:uncharacterized protein (TIGR02246 family)